MTKHIRVLIADDNARSRRGLRALLGAVRLNHLPDTPGSSVHTNAGAEIEVVGEATNGREAVRQVVKFRPDVVLMDIRMPVMNGLEATQHIKSHCPEVRVIALTLYDAYRAKALAAGVDVFLLKGCANEELLATILNNRETDPACAFGGNDE